MLTSVARTARRFYIDRILLTVIAFLLISLWLYPIFLALITSLKPDVEVMGAPLSLPRAPSLDAYKKILDILDFDRMLWNSLFISVLGSALAVILGVLPAYALSRYDIPGADIIFMVLLTGLMIPQQAVIISLYEVMRKLNLLDNLWGLVIIHGVYGIPYMMLLLRGYMVGVPKELEMAARVDGCSDVGVFRHVILPLISPGLVVAGTLNIISVWNELFFSLILLNSNTNFPVAVGYNLFKWGKYFISWNLPSAATILGQLPIVLLYIVAYRYIKQGIYAGAIKG
jgi:ABC-type glycerol-3-phosphate transport system permease component